MHKRFLVWKDLGLFLLFLLGCNITLMGQFPGSGGNSRPNTANQENYFTADTSEVIFFYADRPSVSYTFTDSLIAQYSVQYDPIRRGDLDYIHLGHLGSPHQAVLFSPLVRKGFDIGYHQYDLYQIKASALPFYNITRPFTNIGYSQVAEQSNGFIEAQFSRNFAQGVNLSIDYKRINQLGTQTKYANQDVQNTALAFGLMFRGKTDKYLGFLSIASNTMRQENNGGVSSEPTELEGFRSPTSAEVFLDNAETRHALREIAYTHYFQLGGGVDTLNRIRRTYTIGHRINIAANKYKTFMDTTGISQTIFDEFLLDPRGIRQFISYEKVENEIYLRSFKLANNKRTSNLSAEQDFFQVGLNHSLYLIDQEGGDSTVNNLFLNGTLSLRLKDRLQLNAEAHLGLLDQVGDYSVAGQLSLNLKGLGALELRATNQLASPTLLQTRVFINGQKFWDNKDIFKKTLSTSLEASYSQPKIGLKLTGRYHLINNYIYFDTLGFARQTSIPISLIQLIIQENIRLGPFHLDNVVTLQSSSEDEIRVPDFYTKHSLYYESLWFRTLLIRLGGDLRIQSTYNANYYHPIVGQFVLQNQQDVELYPSLDLFLTFRVTKFQAFFKWENITQTIDPDRLFYLTALHPHSIASGFRVGFKWRFWD